MKNFKLSIMLSLISISFYIQSSQRRESPCGALVPTTQRAVLPEEQIKARQFLGVSNDATQEEVDRAARRLAIRSHPDRPMGNAQQFKLLQEHLAVLKQQRAHNEQNPLLLTNAPARPMRKSSRYGDLSSLELSATVDPRATLADEDPLATVRAQKTNRRKQFQEDIQQTKKRLKYAAGGTGVLVSILYLCRKPTEPNPEHIKRGIGSIASSVASGGVTDMVNTGLKVLMVAGVAYGAKQLKDLVSRPLDHTEKMHEEHQEEIDQTRKAFSRREEKLLLLFDDLKATTEKRQKEDRQYLVGSVESMKEQFERQERQQKLHLEATDTNVFALQKQQRKTQQLEERLARSNQDTRQEREALRREFNVLCEDVKRTQSSLKVVGSESKEHIAAIQSLIEHQRRIEERLATTTTGKATPREPWKPFEEAVPTVTERRGTVCGTLGVQAHHLDTPREEPAVARSASDTGSTASEHQPHAVPRVQQALPPPPPKEDTGCCGFFSKKN